MNLPSGMDFASACIAAHSHPAVRALFGDSLHPGGLDLTARLAALAQLTPGSSVLDAGSGRGVSTVYLAERYGYQVTGVTLEESGVHAGREAASKKNLSGQTRFIAGDYLTFDLEAEPFDAIIMECSLSIIEDQAAALAKSRALLVPGGRLLISDVTVQGPLPGRFQRALDKIGAAGALHSPEGYVALVRSAGFEVSDQEDATLALAGLLKSIKLKLAAAGLAVKLGALPIDPALLPRARDLLAEAQSLVDGGILGYTLLTARRP